MRRLCNFEKLTKKQLRILQSYIKKGLVKHYEFNTCDLLVYGNRLQEDVDSIFNKWENKCVKEFGI